MSFYKLYQCPLGLMPHCYLKEKLLKEISTKLCQCPLGLVPHCYDGSSTWVDAKRRTMVSMPSRASTSLLPSDNPSWDKKDYFVSMPSRASTSLLPGWIDTDLHLCPMCQCPLGLVPHCYTLVESRRASGRTRCQCPLGLLPHFY